MIDGEEQRGTKRRKSGDNIPLLVCGVPIGHENMVDPQTLGIEKTPLAAASRSPGEENEETVQVMEYQDDNASTCSYDDVRILDEQVILIKKCSPSYAEGQFYHNDTINLSYPIQDESHRRDLQMWYTCCKNPPKRNEWNAANALYMKGRQAAEKSTLSEVNELRKSITALTNLVHQNSLKMDNIIDLVSKSSSVSTSNTSLAKSTKSFQSAFKTVKGLFHKRSHERLVDSSRNESNNENMDQGQTTMKPNASPSDMAVVPGSLNSAHVFSMSVLPQSSGKPIGNLQDHAHPMTSSFSVESGISEKGSDLSKVIFARPRKPRKKSITGRERPFISLTAIDKYGTPSRDLLKERFIPKEKEELCLPSGSQNKNHAQKTPQLLDKKKQPESDSSPEVLRHSFSLSSFPYVPSARFPVPSTDVFEKVPELIPVSGSPSDSEPMPDSGPVPRSSPVPDSEPMDDLGPVPDSSPVPDSEPL